MKRVYAILLLSALASQLCLTAYGKKKPVAHELWPNGEVMDEWFADTAKVELSALGRQYRLTDYGVSAGTTDIQTTQIQSVIDRCAREGGGVVVVPRGTFYSGSLFFHQGTHLHIEEGGVLKGSERIRDFAIRQTRIEGQTCQYFVALINADGLDGFTITGRGTIDGSGEPYWEEFWMRKKWNPQCTNKDAQRPRLTYISNSSLARVLTPLGEPKVTWTVSLSRVWPMRSVMLRWSASLSPEPRRASHMLLHAGPTK